MRVRDLEIALVLAREMKAAAARSVDASLRLDQLQEVFGSPELDHGERARIQTALQMAGLEPHPSLLEADPADAIHFGVAAKATASAVAGAAAAGSGPSEPPAADPSDEPPAAFPTVGQFARSKVGRSRRARRGDHIERNGNGSARATPMPDELDDAADEPFVPADELDAVTGAYEAPAEAEEVDHGWEVDDTAEPDERIHDETAVGDVPEEAHYEVEPYPPEEAEDEIRYEPPVAYERYADAPAPEPALEPEPPPPVAPEEPAPSAPARVGADEVVVALLPAVAIPVLVTSIAGWRFGLPFVALSVIATGWLLGRRTREDGRRRGLFATLRSSPAAAAALKTTALVTVLGVVASVLLASVGNDSPTTTGHQTATPAKKPAQPSAAAKPAKPAPKPKHKAQKPKSSAPAKAEPPVAKTAPPAAASTTPAATTASPPPDPGTSGLVRVAPQTGTQSGTSGTSGTQSGTGTP